MTWPDRDFESGPDDGAASDDSSAADGSVDQSNITTDYRLSGRPVVRSPPRP
jgi:hypothetical protein